MKVHHEGTKNTKKRQYLTAEDAEDTQRTRSAPNPLRPLRFLRGPSGEVFFFSVTFVFSW
jgi:hypothetical protein